MSEGFKPSFMDDAIVAIAWLEENEGDTQERQACLSVAEFLRKEWHRRDRAQNKAVAKKFGANVESVTELVNKDRLERGIKTP